MRQGRNSRVPGPKSGDSLRSHRKIAPAAARRGVNTQKDAEAKRNRKRVRRSGSLRAVFRALRSLVIWSLVIGAVGAMGWAGYRAFEGNGFLVLRRVDVVGNRLLDKASILEAAGLELGVKLPAVQLGSVKTSLLSLPGIGNVEVRRIYPSRIEIRVQEKEAVAMGYAKGWYGLSQDGAPISGLDWSLSDLPVVDGFAALDSAGKARLAQFLQAAKAAYPNVYANFSQLTVRDKGGNAVEIVLRDGRLKVLLDFNKSLNSLEFLQALMSQQAGALEHGNTIDLRVEGLAYVR